MYASTVPEKDQVQITEKQAFKILEDLTLVNPPYMVLNLAGKMAVTEFVLENTSFEKRVPIGQWFDEAERNASDNYPVEDVVVVVGSEVSRSGQDQCLTLQGDHFDWYVPIYGNEEALKQLAVGVRE